LGAGQQQTQPISISIVTASLRASINMGKVLREAITII
jgi:hypothetical protein